MGFHHLFIALMSIDIISWPLIRLYAPFILTSVGVGAANPVGIMGVPRHLLHSCAYFRALFLSAGGLSNLQPGPLFYGKPLN